MLMAQLEHQWCFDSYCMSVDSLQAKRATLSNGKRMVILAFQRHLLYER